MKRKYLCSFLAVLLLWVATGCTESNSDEGDNAMTLVGDQPDMIIEVEAQSIKLRDISEPMTFIVRNFSDEEYMSGYGYRLEHYDGHEWVPIPLLPDHGFFLEGVPIEPGKEAVLPLSLAIHDFVFVPGRYRVTYDKWHGEFTITK